MDEGRESSIDRERRVMREALEKIANRICECPLPPRTPGEECGPCVAFGALHALGKTKNKYSPASAREASEKKL